MNKLLPIFLFLSVLSAIILVEAMTIELKSPSNNSIINASPLSVNFTFNATWSFGGLDPSVHENVSNCSLWINSTNPAIEWRKNFTVDPIRGDAQILNGSIGLSYMNFTFDSDGNYTYAISCLNFTNASTPSGLTFSSNFSFIIDVSPPKINFMLNETISTNITINITANITDEIGLSSANITYNMTNNMNVLTKINFTLSGNKATIHHVANFNGSSGDVINVTFYATDISNHVAQNSILITTIDVIPPTIRVSINNTSPKTGDFINISANI